MAKGGESLGNEEGSEEEEEVIPAENHMPRVRPLTLGVVLPAAIPPNQFFAAERSSHRMSRYALRLSTLLGTQVGNQDA
jgi:hypothetical protein